MERRFSVPAWCERTLTLSEFDSATKALGLELEPGHFLHHYNTGSRSMVLVTEGLEVQHPQNLLWQLNKLGLKLWTHHPTPDELPPYVTGNWINKQIVFGCLKAEDIHPNDGICFYKRDEYFPLAWQESQPMCSPGALLQREMFGRRSDMGRFARSCDYYELARSQQQQHEEDWQVEERQRSAANMPVGGRNPGNAKLLGVLEYCDILDVQYVVKMMAATAAEDEDCWQQQQQQQRDSIDLTQQQQLAPSPLQLIMQRQQQEADADQHRYVFSAIITLRQQQPQQEWQHRNNSGTHSQQGRPSGVAWAPVITIDYPLFAEGNHSDFIVPRAVFNQGIRDWATLRVDEPFQMKWIDGVYGGRVTGYVSRQLRHKYFTSPWQRLKVSWDGMSDQESRQQGFDKVNPWEAKPKRMPGYQQTPPQQRGTTAMVQTAPWVIAVTAAARPRQKGQKRHLDDDYMSGDDLDDPTDVGTDSGSDFENDLQHHIADCDESALRHNHHRSSTRRRRLAQHRPGNMLHNSGRARVPRDPSHPQHNCGRQIIGVAPDVCVVCRKGSDLGELVSCNAAAAGTCDRRYHRGCLLLLNAAGIGVASSSLRAAAAAVVRARGTAAGSSGGTQGEHASSSSSNGSLDGVQGYDGLLRQLHQQQQRQQLSSAPAVAAAVDTLTSTLSALRLQQQQQQQGLHVRCPAHYCHGCNLNGKATNLLWCCCCWVRTYHRRRCIPPSAERVTVGGREYVRCPWCVAAGVAVPSAATAAGGALPSAAPAAAAAEAVPAAAAAATEAGLSADAAAAEEAVPSPAAGEGGPSAAAAAADARPSAAGTAAVPLPAAAARQPAAPSPATGATVPSGSAAAAVHIVPPPPPPAAAATTAAAATGLVTEADVAAAAGKERLTSVGPVTAAVNLPGAVLGTQDINQPKAAEVAHTLDNPQRQQQQQQQHEEPHAASSASTCRPTGRGGSASGVTAGQRGVRPGQQQQQQAARVVIDLTLDDDRPQVLRSRAAVAAAAAGSDVIVIDSDSEDEPACRTSVPLDSSSSGYRTGNGQSRSGAGAADEFALWTPTAAARTPCQPPAQTGIVPANVGHKDDRIHQQQQQQQQLLEDADRVQNLQQQQQRQQQPDHSVQVQQLLPQSAALSMPSWLMSALTDTERLNPSFKLVPHAATAATATVQQQAAVSLQQAAAAAASRVVVPAAALLSAATAARSTVDPQGDHQQQQQLQQQQQGLPLASPQTHWLIGDYAKAESQYKVPGTHLIGIPATGQLYGLCLIIDHMSQSSRLGLAGSGSAGSGSSQLVPRVYLRYGKAGKNTSNRRQQQQQQQQQGDDVLTADAEAPTGDHEGTLRQDTATELELKVLVDGRVLSRGQQEELAVGSVMSVQGLQFRLDTCR